MNSIQNLLQEKIGFYLPTVGSSFVRAAVKSRMLALGLLKRSEYLQLLEQSSAELSALIDSVVITETWFFRDKEPFSALALLVKREWLPRKSSEPLKILSLPCSSGEEPYSIVMTLLEAGLSADQFQIDAVDISSRALTAARRGVYRKNSFRTRDLSFRDRYFKLTEEGYVLNEEIRDQVHFIQGNATNKSTLPTGTKYDFVFCRNLLIYFDETTQKSVLNTLSDLLVPSGVLFLGAAEMTLALSQGFVSAQMPLSFACRRRGELPSRVSDAVVNAGNKRQSKSRLLFTTRLPSSNKSQLTSERNLELPFSSFEYSQSDLKRARELAALGELAEAENICETHLRQNGVSADAYFLLGLVRAADGSSTLARDFYRKALYLDSGHYETLIQLARLSEQRGQNSQAQIFYKRAERTKQRA